MTALSKGSVIQGTYEIIEEIGSGGGGVVYKAKHLRLNSFVVVKKIKDEIRDRVATRQEADILKRLKHPFLPRVYDFIESEDGVYTVMDFIDGQNLDEALRKKGSFREPQVRKWAVQLGEALDYLHSQNPPIIHSDIKPSNIMLTQDDNICLIDFNIALAIGEKEESAVGISAGFSPPEQYCDPYVYLRYASSDAFSDDDATEVLDKNGNTTEKLPRESAIDTVKLTDYGQLFGKGIDTRSDIFSLGMTLINLLTGRKPDSDFSSLLTLSELSQIVSEGFASIIAKMIDIRPEKRFRSGKEYSKAISNCYKYDSRYKRVYRIETTLQIIAATMFVIGMFTLLYGLNKVRINGYTEYINAIEQAHMLEDQGNYREALRIFGQLEEKEPDTIDAYEEEVYAMYLSGNCEECIDTGRRYIETAPFLLVSDSEKESFGNIYYIVGNAYYEMGDYDNALRMLKSAVEYNQSNALIFRDIAIIEAKNGDIETAKDNMKKADAVGMSRDSVLLASGEIAVAESNYEKAVTDFEQCIQLTDDTAIWKRAVLLCADAYKEMGSDYTDLGIVMLEDAIKRSGLSYYPDIEQTLAEFYLRKASTDKEHKDKWMISALDIYQNIISTGYVSYNLMENTAIINENIGNLDEAEKILMSMLDEYPNRYSVYKRLAFLEADKQQNLDMIERDYSSMLTYYRKAVEVYDSSTQDMEMSMLDSMIEELREGGWLTED